MQLFEVRYIGRCKDKGRGSQAFGWVNDGWMLILSEEVLRNWFEDTAAPGEASTLYAVLGAKQNDDTEKIKSCWRRMAMQWHPDRCKDPDAHNQFIRIQEAYAILSDPFKRAKYNAGLKLQASIEFGKKYAPIMEEKYGYRSPLKCGSLLVDGQQSGRWFVVSNILMWEDVTRGDKVLVASWPMGAKEPQEQWV